MSRRLLALIACALALALTAAPGCQWKGGHRPTREAHGPAATLPADAEAWRPEPVRVRVYPASRFAREGGRAVLEARVELLDAMGDSVKGGGQLHFELLDAARARGSADGGRLYAWDVPLLTLEQQKRAYDPITRAYLFRLLLDGPAPPGGDTLLRVVFAPPGKDRLGAEMRLSGAGKGP